MRYPGWKWKGQGAGQWLSLALRRQHVMQKLHCGNDYTKYRLKVWTRLLIYFEWAGEFKLLTGTVCSASGFFFLLILMHTFCLLIKKLFWVKLFWHDTTHLKRGLCPRWCPAYFSWACKYLFFSWCSNYLSPTTLLNQLWRKIDRATVDVTLLRFASCILCYQSW